MFFDTSAYRQPFEGTRDDREHGIVVLLPAESKRLIARAVVKLPVVRRALDQGLVLVCRGITPSYVVEELTGTPIQDRGYCTSGIVTEGHLAGTRPENAQGPWVFRQGALSEDPFADALGEFTASDVAIKGANAVDTQGNIGVISGADDGATIGTIWPIITPRGAHLITPVGLEKLIPSVIDAARQTGVKVFKYVMDWPVGLVPVTTSSVVTEVQALEILTGVTATHVASGGVGGSEGAVIIALEGADDVVRPAFELVKGIKGEPPVAAPELLPSSPTS